MKMNICNCSLEFNSSNGGNAPKLLIQFLRSETRNEACFARPTGCPGIAVPPGAAHPQVCGETIHIYKETEGVELGLHGTPPLLCILWSPWTRIVTRSIPLHWWQPAVNSSRHLIRAGTSTLWANIPVVTPVRDGAYVSFAEYRFAIKARLNLLPTKVVVKRRGNLQLDTTCPKCNSPFTQ